MYAVRIIEYAIDSRGRFCSMFFFLLWIFIYFFFSFALLLITVKTTRNWFWPWFMQLMFKFVIVFWSSIEYNACVLYDCTRKPVSVFFLLLLLFLECKSKQLFNCITGYIGMTLKLKQHKRIKACKQFDQFYRKKNNNKKKTHKFQTPASKVITVKLQQDVNCIGFHDQNRWHWCQIFVQKSFFFVVFPFKFGFNFTLQLNFNSMLSSRIQCFSTTQANQNQCDLISFPYYTTLHLIESMNKRYILH